MRINRSRNAPSRRIVAQQPPETQIFMIGDGQTDVFGSRSNKKNNHLMCGVQSECAGIGLYRIQQGIHFPCE
jgi:hypothetical protein